MNSAFDLAEAVAYELGRYTGLADANAAAVREALAQLGLPAVLAIAVTPLPGVELDKLTAVPRVSVVPKSVQPQHMTRSGRADNVTIDIGIQAKIIGSPETDVPKLCRLVRTLLDFMWGRALTRAPEAVFMEAGIDPVYAPDHLQQLRVFTSVVSVTYKVGV
jgi:hypothetical protein